jgi:Phosphopantetheine attachment site.
MQNDELEEIIKTLLAETIEDMGAKESWNTDTDIINDIGIDSIQIVRFMLSLEDALGVSLDFEELSFEDFSSIGALAKLVEATMGENL